MKVDLNAKVRTRDGEYVGNIIRAIIDPDTSRVSDFVMNTGAFLGRDILLPSKDLELATGDGQEVFLDLSKEDLDALPAYVPANYGPPPASWLVPSGVDTDTAMYLWPMTDGGISPPGIEASGGYHSASPVDPRASDISVSKGEAVADLHGEKVGVVEEVRLDPKYEQLQGFVLRIGSGFETFFGGGKTIEVQRDHIDHVDNDTVYLSISKERLKEDPAA